MPLQDLDLVTVGIDDKEEFGKQGALAEELLHPRRFQTLRLEPAVLGLEILDGEGDMAIAVAELVGPLTVVVDRQLDFEIGRLISQIDQREAVKRETVRDLKSEARL